MVPERVRMSNGGEALEDVIGRGEEEELPEFRNGAFEVDGGVGGEERGLVNSEFLNEYVQRGEIGRHTMRELIGSIRVVPSREFQCSEVCWVLLVSVVHCFCSLFLTLLRKSVLAVD